MHGDERNSEFLHGGRKLALRGIGVVAADYGVDAAHAQQGPKDGNQKRPIAPLGGIVLRTRGGIIVVVDEIRQEGSRQQLDDEAWQRDDIHPIGAGKRRQRVLGETFFRQDHHGAGIRGFRAFERAQGREHQQSGKTRGIASRGRPHGARVDLLKGG
jgi:hypothetical protein